MSSLREKCDNKKRCGQTGHFFEDGRWKRCPCLELEINKKKLGQMFCDNPAKTSPLTLKTERNLRLEGALASIRPHVAGALLSLSQRGQNYVIMDAYRLIEIYLEKDADFETTRPTIETDLLIILLGFGDPRNRYLPELLVQALNRRELIQKPTWVIMGLDFQQVSHKYSAELQAMLQNFEKVTTK